MLNKNVAKAIQDELHEIIEALELDITIDITHDIRKYDTAKRNKDNDKYTPAVLRAAGDPFHFSSLDAKVYSYELLIYGFSKDRDNLEKVFNLYSNQTRGTIEVEGQDVVKYISRLEVNDFKSSSDGLNDKRFEAVVDIDLHATPDVVKGIETSIKIGEDLLPFHLLRFRKDISLIPNVKYGGNNTSVKLISEQMQIEVPVYKDSSLVQNLLMDVLAENYNKLYELKYEINNIVKTTSMTLRVGTIEYNRTHMPVTMWLTFERALSRKEFTIDETTIPVLRWAYSSNTELTSKSTENSVKSKPLGLGRTISALFVNDGSEKMKELIANINLIDKTKRFEIEYEINDVKFNYNMIVKDGTIQVTEHPDLIVECLFVEGD